MHTITQTKWKGKLKLQKKIALWYYNKKNILILTELTEGEEYKDENDS